MEKSVGNKDHAMASDHVGAIADVFVWDLQFETGISEIDLQHQNLVQLINSLGQILAVETDALSFVQSLFGVFDKLAEYVKYHFKFEEELMAVYCHEDAHVETHKQAHTGFINRIADARIAANEHPAEVTGSTLSFLTIWLMTHIVGTDMRMAKKILAIQSGIPEVEATLQANGFMINATDALLQAMSRLYNNMAKRTQNLLDVKRRLDREIELRKSNESELRKLSRAVEQSPVSIVITNINGEFEYVNPKFTQLTGYTIVELAGKTPSVLKSGDTPTSVYENLWSTITSGKEWHGEVHNRKKNGELYWDYAAISPVFDASGKITNFVSIQENITERKWAEDSLRQQKQLSDDIINSLPGIFYMLNQQGRFLRVNPQLIEVTGYQKDELDHMTVLDFFDEDGKNVIGERMHEVFEKADSWAEAELITKSGQKIPYYFTGHRTKIDGEYYLVGLGTDITQRRSLEQELSRQAKTDSLTGLSNRRHFIEMAEQELVRTRRYDNLLSVLMLDLDDFKAINDRYGHEAGDNVLRKVSDVCRLTLRGIDVIGRIGGEEFAILLPETHSKQAQEVAERLRHQIEDAQIFVEPDGVLHVTASIGVTTLNTTDTDVNRLLKLADKALYEAKRTGRNKVCVA
jgi:diguanylate cyclase (GGDEF)-like protein/hemerythrin-like metal-binding protein/PAS domain S-box-containing protein